MEKKRFATWRIHPETLNRPNPDSTDAQPNITSAILYIPPEDRPHGQGGEPA